MRIALDTVGGKYAPDAILEGAILALRRWHNIDLTLVGDSRKLQTLIGSVEISAEEAGRLTFVEGPGLIADAESPVEALDSKPDSSILVMLEAHRRGEVDAVVSAGSTGAQIVATIRTLGLLEGVLRPAIGSYFPAENGKTFLIDVGANAACRPIHMLQFAAMGALFREHLDSIENPRVALLSNGEESTKGSPVTRDAHELMAIVPKLNFIGNIEGHDIFSGKADVVVCDGFTGNILLKFAESIPHMLKSGTTIAGTETATNQEELENLVRPFDYQEFGGVPLLGVNGVSIICHGHSTPRAIMNAIGEAAKMVRMKVNDHIREQLSTLGHWSAVIKTRHLFRRMRRRSSRKKQ